MANERLVYQMPGQETLQKRHRLDIVIRSLLSHSELHKLCDITLADQVALSGGEHPDT